MINIKHVQTDDFVHIKTIVEYKHKLMKYHSQFAEQLGISDDELKNYSDSRALETLSERDSYLIFLDNEVIGYIQTEIKKSIVGNDNVLFIHGLYIDEPYRNRSYGITACKRLYEKYKMGIECQCWYNLPAAKIYEKLGFKNIVTHYYLPYK